MSIWADLLTAPQPSALNLALQAWIEEQEQRLRQGYELYRQYYRGDHRSQLTDRLKKFLPQTLEFRDNFMDVVVDVAAERLNLIGFDSGKQEAISEVIWDWWQGNRMDAVQRLVHTEAMIQGDAYIMVTWEEGQPRFYYQDPQMIVARYNANTRRLEFVSKKWTETHEIGQPATIRLNIYYPERIEKYRASGGVWLHHQDEGEREWPLPWRDKAGQPLGIPIVHFRNRALSDDFGLSELSDLIPLQDLLNKTLIDLMMILDTQAFRQRWTLGVEAPAQYDITPGAVWDLQSEDPANARVGEFGVSEIEGPLRAIETIIQHIAGQSRTPQHLFHISGDYPSGEALKTAEAGLVHKVKEKQVNFGNSWEDLMYIALKLQEVFGRALSAEGVMLSALWADPETRNEKAHLEGLKFKAELGITRDQLWREMGYSQEQIEQMHKDRQGEKVEDSNIGAEILKSFNQGRQGGAEGIGGAPRIPRRVTRTLERDVHGRALRVVEEEQDAPVRLSSE